MVDQWIQKWIAANDEESPEMGKDPSTSKKRKSMPADMPAAPPAQKVSATPMLPPVPPPAPAQKETASAIKRISWADASKLLGEDNFEMIFWENYPNRMGLQNTHDGDTWLINEESTIHSEDAANAIKEHPKTFEKITWTYKEYTGPYLKNKKINRLSRIFS